MRAGVCVCTHAFAYARERESLIMVIMAVSHLPQVPAADDERRRVAVCDYLFLDIVVYYALI